MNLSLSPRPFQPDADFLPLLRLRGEVEAIDQTGTAITEAVLRQQMELPGHDPALDRWVVADPDHAGQLVGSAMVWVAPTEGLKAARFDVTVHPTWRGRGLGSALLDCVLERAAGLGAATAEVYALEKLKPSGAFLARRGFQVAGAFTELRAPASQKLPSPVWPYGYSLRTFAEIQDVSILTEAMNRCYEGLWGHHEVSQEQMAEWLPDFTPEGLFLVFSEKGRVVGISRVEVSAERSARNGALTGYIDAPGIVSPHRRHDLYRALLITGVRWLQSQEQEIIEMESWGDRPDVLELYQQMGFAVVRRAVAHTKKLA